MQQCWLREAQSRSYVPSHPEVRVLGEGRGREGSEGIGSGQKTDLVNGTGNETVDVLALLEDVGEGSAERRSCLHSWKSDLANAVSVHKAKYPLRLVHCHTLLNAQYIAVEVWTRAAGNIMSITLYQVQGALGDGLTPHVV